MMRQMNMHQLANLLRDVRVMDEANETSGIATRFGRNNSTAASTSACVARHRPAALNPGNCGEAAPRKRFDNHCKLAGVAEPRS
jgi:hypothetical protein